MTSFATYCNWLEAALPAVPDYEPMLKVGNTAGLCKRMIAEGICVPDLSEFPGAQPENDAKSVEVTAP